MEGQEALVDITPEEAFLNRHLAQKCQWTEGTRSWLWEDRPVPVIILMERRG